MLLFNYYIYDIYIYILRLYLYGGLGWWFGSLGNQSYVQNRFEKCVFFVCFVFVLFFV